MKAREVLIVAAGLSGLGYALLAREAAEASPLVWLLGAQVVGWVALALVWRCADAELETPRALAGIVAAAVIYRLIGIGTVPGWEDDYFRHLWDGWMSWRSGSPYGVAPQEWFGADGLGGGMDAVLDGVNHPEHATIYGPVAQAWSAAAAGLAQVTGATELAGRLAIFKAGLVMAELAAGWALWRTGGVRALLFFAWCPLAVTEIAFAGHVDAFVVAAVAGALAAARRGRVVAACALVALACASKAYALLLAPFFLWRAGWRGAVLFALVLIATYTPWMVATLRAGRELATVWGAGGVGAMAGTFEFNSTGYALLAWALGDGAGRWAAMALLGGGLGMIWARWAMRKETSEKNGFKNYVTKLVTASPGEDGKVGAVVPGAAVVGWWALWSPVFHPWYALLALPFLALRPSGWGVGMLAVVPLSYVHGLLLGAGASGDFRHPVWVRPAEVLGVALGAMVARWRTRRPQ